MFLTLFSSFAPNPCLESHLGNVNRHFTFSPNAGSNITRLLLATRFDYAGGLDKIWDYKLLVYITDDNLLSGRKKAEALVETGTVTLSISVIPHPTTIVTTTPRVRIWGPALRSLWLTSWSPLTQEKYVGWLNRVEVLGCCQKWRPWAKLEESLWVNRDLGVA